MKFQKYTHRSLLTIPALALVCSMSTLAQAQAVEVTEPTPETPVVDESLAGQGKLVFLTKIQETGEILDTEITNLTYTFRNTGKGPLTIEHIKPTCGCTVPELNKKTYMPGEHGTLTVEFDPKGKHGALTRSIAIFTDSEKTPNDTIVVRTIVKPVVLIEPAVLPFNSIEKGETVTKEFKIYGRTDDFKVTRATTDLNDTFDIKVVDGGKVEKNGEMLTLQIIKLTVKPDAKPNSHRTEISVRTNDERRSIFSISAAVRVMGDLSANPIRVTLGRLAVGDEFTREFHVVSKSNTAFEIKSVNADSNAIEANYEFIPVDPELRNDWIVRLKGTVVNSAARFNTQLHIATDVKDEEMINVQMYGQLQRQ
tara:strand:+ start:23841 stop:24941 length:1101 start_codon:yes stop_codon:yes gene_type:complete